MAHLGDNPISIGQRQIHEGRREFIKELERRVAQSDKSSALLSSLSKLYHLLREDIWRQTRADFNFQEDHLAFDIVDEHGHAVLGRLGPVEQVRRVTFANTR